METKLSDKEIIQNVMDSLGIKSPEFAKELELSSVTSIYNIKNGVHGISNEMINKIITKYPEVNYLYLKRGQGTPLRNQGADTTIQKNLFSKTTKEITLHDLLKMPEKLEKLEQEVEDLKNKIEGLITFFKK